MLPRCPIEPRKRRTRRNGARISRLLCSRTGWAGTAWLLMAGWMAGVPATLGGPRLWLPNEERGLMPLLEAAARQAKATDRCGEVLAGGSNARYSEGPRYAFMITCRDSGSGSSYYLIFRQDDTGALALVREQPRALDWQPADDRLPLTSPGGTHRGDSPAAVTAAQPQPSMRNGPPGPVASANDAADSTAASGEPSNDDRANIGTSDNDRYGNAILRNSGYDSKGSRSGVRSASSSQTTSSSEEPLSDHSPKLPDLADDNTKVSRSTPEAPAANADFPAVEAEVAWELCLQKLRQSTERMIDVVIYTQPRPRPSSSSAGWHYQIDFDARNPRGDELYFRARCATDGDDVELNLRGRHDQDA